jgi:N utilization substance protein B
VDKKLIRAQKRARKLALQALYQWLMTDQELYEVEAQFRAINNMDKVDSEYFTKLLREIPKNIESLESSFESFLDRPIKGLNPIELTVLRIGAYELTFCLHIPYKVVLDESISLAKEFGSQDGHKYVNGILHKLAQTVRAVEMNSTHE